jgi:phosphoribosylanthranilate isomerase
MRIIATDIANLTDARYFAAWGVEGMAFNIDPSASGSLSGIQLKEIVEWVEGPATMIKMEGLEIPEILHDIKSQIDIQSIIIGPFIDASHLPDFKSVYRICTLEDGLQDGDRLILSYPFEIDKISPQQTERIKKLTQSKEVFLDANFSASDLDKIRALGFVGIILKGGEEEKVGFKSFDELDAILEAISEE